ncbi:hypothetical protein MYX84_00935 [Acidobacteria bacterium AH-259-O06]|nr:hypothetical protein [Acidobacteria bacterium AH-259-O06]
MPAERMYIPCKISLGLFEGERIVQFEVEGTEYSTIVDSEDVHESKMPQQGEWVDGLLQVYAIKKNGETVIVNLPRETASSGRRITVPKQLLQTA